MPVKKTKFLPDQEIKRRLDEIDKRMAKYDARIDKANAGIERQKIVLEELQLRCRHHKRAREYYDPP